MKKVFVKMRVNITKSFLLKVPEHTTHIKFVKALMEEDPACCFQKVSHSVYDPETEVPVSIEFFKKECLAPYSENKSIQKRCNKLALFIYDYKPLEALHRLTLQASRDGNVQADRIVKMVEPFRYQFTVNELLKAVKD